MSARYSILLIDTKSERPIDSTESLYDAAGIVHAEFKARRGCNPVVALDTETGNRYSYQELFDGGFMDDALTHAEFSLRC